MIKKEYLDKFDGNSGVSSELLNSIKLPERLPSDYIELIKNYNGGEGFVGEEYLILEKVEEFLEVNESCGIEEFDNNIFLIGSNGGGEAVAIDFRNKKPIYILIPYIFEYEAIIELGTSLEEFFERIHKEGFFGKNKD